MCNRFVWNLITFFIFLPYKTLESIHLIHTMMKDDILRFKFLMILMMVMNVVDAQGQELPISDAQHSGCLRVSDYEEEEEEV